MMKKSILLTLCLILGIVAVKLSVIPLFQKPDEPLVVHDVNILSSLKRSAKEKGTLNYLVLGDSVARGMGSQKPVQGYGSLVAKGLGKEEISLKLINKGVSGQTSGKLAEYLQTPDIQEKIEEADLISLTIGGNDLVKVALDDQNLISVWNKFNSIQKDYGKNLTRILADIRRWNPDAPIILTTLYNPLSPDVAFYRISNSLLNNWNDTMKQTANRYPLTHVVDIHQRLQELQGNWLADQIHPNNKGYRMIAEGILDEIRSGEHVSASAE
ncbi:hypothetical protein GXN76_10875 [Kroppenstedtia pulmonis]|uniref:SGNH hydrolase-type esterase domain-containing protein n=1 Tax=Kroppenstedtia pulmonis TaxID=1380685 RepID=A0A7D3XR99_9BACL|nr:GDSL-type esterase/lipase family protein [Kroppenstedtia pulmonis]QKG84922.1 hypothetical protein GXN76_10875 [Kroppenstedtia pulmonis]